MRLIVRRVSRCNAFLYFVKHEVVSLLGPPHHQSFTYLGEASDVPFAVCNDWCWNRSLVEYLVVGFEQSLSRILGL
jgi:hypothetical protein